MSDDLVEEVAKALFTKAVSLSKFHAFPWEQQDEKDRDEWRQQAKAVIPLIVARERERCAGICDNAALGFKRSVRRASVANGDCEAFNEKAQLCGELASAIRSNTE